MSEFCRKSISGNELFQLEVTKFLCGWLFCGDASNSLNSLYSELENQKPEAETKPVAVWKDEKLINPDFRELLNHKNFAFDLPVWLNAEITKKKLMIISKEPCLTHLATQETGSLSINLPWSLTDSKLEKVWPMFLDNNISLYFTKLKKFYVNDSEKGHNKIYKVLQKFSEEEIAGKFENTVENEIYVFKPNFILFIDSIFDPEFEPLVEYIKSKNIPCDYIMNPVNYTATAELYERRTKEILKTIE